MAYYIELIEYHRWQFDPQHGHVVVSVLLSGVSEIETIAARFKVLLEVIVDQRSRYKTPDWVHQLRVPLVLTPQSIGKINHLFDVFLRQMPYAQNK